MAREEKLKSVPLLPRIKQIHESKDANFEGSFRAPNTQQFKQTLQKHLGVQKDQVDKVEHAASDRGCLRFLDSRTQKLMKPTETIGYKNGKNHARMWFNIYKRITLFEYRIKRAKTDKPEFKGAPAKLWTELLSLEQLAIDILKKIRSYDKREENNPISTKAFMGAMQKDEKMLKSLNHLIYKPNYENSLNEFLTIVSYLKESIEDTTNKETLLGKLESESDYFDWVTENKLTDEQIETRQKELIQSMFDREEEYKDEVKVDKKQANETWQTIESEIKDGGDVPDYEAFGVAKTFSKRINQEYKLGYTRTDTSRRKTILLEQLGIDSLPDVQVMKIMEVNAAVEERRKPKNISVTNRKKALIALTKFDEKKQPSRYFNIFFSGGKVKNQSFSPIVTEAQVRHVLGLNQNAFVDEKTHNNQAKAKILKLWSLNKKKQQKQDKPNDDDDDDDKKNGGEQDKPDDDDDDDDDKNDGGDGGDQGGDPSIEQESEDIIADSNLSIIPPSSSLLSLIPPKPVIPSISYAALLPPVIPSLMVPPSNQPLIINPSKPPSIMPSIMPPTISSDLKQEEEEEEDMGFDDSNVSVVSVPSSIIISKEQDDIASYKQAIKNKDIKTWDFITRRYIPNYDLLDRQETLQKIMEISKTDDKHLALTLIRRPARMTLLGKYLAEERQRIFGSSFAQPVPPQPALKFTSLHFKWLLGLPKGFNTVSMDTDAEPIKTLKNQYKEFISLYAGYLVELDWVKHVFSKGKDWLESAFDIYDSKEEKKLLHDFEDLKNDIPKNTALSTKLQASVKLRRQIALQRYQNVLDDAKLSSKWYFMRPSFAFDTLNVEKIGILVGTQRQFQRTPKEYVIASYLDSDRTIHEILNLELKEREQRQQPPPLSPPSFPPSSPLTPAAQFQKILLPLINELPQLQTSLPSELYLPPLPWSRNPIQRRESEGLLLQNPNDYSQYDMGPKIVDWDKNKTAAPFYTGLLFDHRWRNVDQPNTDKYAELMSIYSAQRTDNSFLALAVVARSPRPILKNGLLSVSAGKAQFAGGDIKKDIDFTQNVAEFRWLEVDDSNKSENPGVMKKVMFWWAMLNSRSLRKIKNNQTEYEIKDLELPKNKRDYEKDDKQNHEFVGVFYGDKKDIKLNDLKFWLQMGFNMMSQSLVNSIKNQRKMKGWQDIDLSGIQLFQPEKKEHEYYILRRYPTEKEILKGLSIAIRPMLSFSPTSSSSFSPSFELNLPEDNKEEDIKVNQLFPPSPIDIPASSISKSPPKPVFDVEEEEEEEGEKEYNTVENRMNLAYLPGNTVGADLRYAEIIQKLDDLKKKKQNWKQQQGIKASNNLKKTSETPDFHGYYAKDQPLGIIAPGKSQWYYVVETAGKNKTKRWTLYDKPAAESNLNLITAARGSTLASLVAQEKIPNPNQIYIKECGGLGHCLFYVLARALNSHYKITDPNKQFTNAAMRELAAREVTLSNLTRILQYYRIDEQEAINYPRRQRIRQTWKYSSFAQKAMEEKWTEEEKLAAFRNSIRNTEDSYFMGDMTMAELLLNSDYLKQNSIDIYIIYPKQDKKGHQTGTAVTKVVANMQSEDKKESKQRENRENVVLIFNPSAHYQLLGVNYIPLDPVTYVVNRKQLPEAYKYWIDQTL